MAFLTWSKDLSVNIKEIDQQHMKLVEMLNKLHESMKTGKSNEILFGIVGDMKKYAATHFATEEKHMKAHSYPSYTAHKAEHDKFVSTVAQVENDCKAGKCIISIEILNFLKKWLAEHILGTDKKYGPFLNERGVK